jgi:probable phosphoglycerate mutase
MEIYFVRHGQTEWNVERRMQGQNDSALTEKGIADSQALGERLSDICFDGIWCSPAGRTKHTLRLILGEKRIPVRYDDRLLEIDLDEWEGKTKSELEQDPENETLVHAFWEAPDKFTPEWGESFEEVQERIVDFFNELVARHSCKKVLVVTHTTVIKTFLCYLTQTPISNLWKTKAIYPSSLTQLNYKDEKWSIVLEGDIEHYNNIPSGKY